MEIDEVLLGTARVSCAMVEVRIVDNGTVVRTKRMWVITDWEPWVLKDEQCSVEGHAGNVIIFDGARFLEASVEVGHTNEPQEFQKVSFRNAMYNLLSDTDSDAVREAALEAQKPQKLFTVRRTVTSNKQQNETDRAAPTEALTKDIPNIPIHMRLTAARRSSPHVTNHESRLESGVASPYGFVDICSNDGADTLTLVLHVQEQQDGKEGGTKLLKCSSPLLTIETTRGVYSALFRNFILFKLHQKALFSIMDLLQNTDELVQRLSHDFRALSEKYDAQERLYCTAAAHLLNAKKRRIRELKEEVERLRQDGEEQSTKKVKQCLAPDPVKSCTISTPDLSKKQKQELTSSPPTPVTPSSRRCKMKSATQKPGVSEKTAGGEHNVDMWDF